MIEYMTKDKPYKGKKPTKRPVKGTKGDVKPQGNQWTATQQQMDWLTYYMDPKETETYGKPYHAAVKAGYSHHYAKNIMNPSTALQWVQAAQNVMRRMNTEHIKNALEEVALNETGYEKTGDRLTALKMLGTDQGMFVQRSVTNHVGLEEALKELE